VSEFSLAALKQILESCSGALEDTDWNDANFTQLTFDEIGYDSIALLEMAARVQQAYGVHIPDEAISELKTPEIVLDYVNELLSSS
jgi:acyl carrier protein